MKVGDLVRYKKRYIGQMFVVLEIKVYPNTIKGSDWRVKCMRVLPPDGKHTRWSDIRTIEVLNEV
jgi:membrane protein implicated in regulation of membrane protease activity